MLGGVVGVGIAAALMALMPLWLSPAVTQGVVIDYPLTASAVAQGVGTGLLVSLLFAIVPLLDVRHVKPSQLLRDETAGGARDWLRWAVMAGGRRRAGWPHHVAGRIGADRRHRRHRLRRRGRRALWAPDWR